MDTPARTTLRPDYNISRLIKGGWQLAGDHGEVERTRAIDDMVAFVDAGVTTFDCADIYTGVEDMLGQFRTALANQRGADAAKQIRIHTKYVPDINNLRSLSATQVASSIERSLRQLKMDRLDLVQFHWWDYAAPGVIETVGFLHSLQQQGKIDQIGITNFDAAHMRALCGEFDITSAQIQYSLLDRRAAGEFSQLARQHNVHLLVYGVLAGGFLTDQWLGVDDPGFEFTNRSLVKYRLIIEEFGGWALFQTLLETLRHIADHHHVDIDTIALKAMLDNPDVSACIVGARYANRLSRTLRAFDVTLEHKDRSAINAVLQRSSGPGGDVFALERDTSGVHGRIMKYNINSGDTHQLRHQTPGGSAGEVTDRQS